MSLFEKLKDVYPISYSRNISTPYGYDNAGATVYVNTVGSVCNSIDVLPPAGSYDFMVVKSISFSPEALDVVAVSGQDSGMCRVMTSLSAEPLVSFDIQYNPYTILCNSVIPLKSSNKITFTFERFSAQQNAYLPLNSNSTKVVNGATVKKYLVVGLNIEFIKQK